MSEHHPGTGIAHDLADIFLCTGFVAVNGTILAGGLAFPERTPFQSVLGILMEFPAAFAVFNIQLMMIATIDADHGGDGGGFPEHAVGENGHVFLALLPRF